MNAIAYAARPSVLDGFGFFAGLTAGDRLAVARRCRVASVPRGTTIFEQDAEVGEVILVLSGTLRLASFSENGKELVYCWMVPGDSVGVSTAWAGAQSVGSVTAETDAEVVFVPVGVLREACARHPSVAVAVIDYLAERAVRNARRLRDLANFNPKQRVYAAILRSVEAAQPLAGSEIVVAMPDQGELARQCGVTRETVCRAVNHLKKHGVISARKTGRDTMLVVHEPGFVEALLLEE